MSTPQEINQSSYGELKKILQEIDPEGNLKDFSGNIPDDHLLRPIEDYFQDGRYRKRAVLGMDIYRYSQYPEEKQRLIPVIFNLLYEATIDQCLKTQRFLFQKYNNKDDFLRHFIHTGDGGFQIFDTPLHILIFAIYFQAKVQDYNSYTAYPRLRSYIGDIELRYTMTYDNLFRLGSNYFGPAIISNARILSKDKLNRCLIDYGTHDWFLRRTKGLETLKRFPFDGIVKLSDFKENGYELPKSISPQENGLFYRDGKESLLDVHVSKIGYVTAKQNSLDIFNLHLQAYLRVHDSLNDTKSTPLVVSLGNLNTTGITESP